MEQLNAEYTKTSLHLLKQILIEQGVEVEINDKKIRVFDSTTDFGQEYLILDDNNDVYNIFTDADNRIYYLYCNNSNESYSFPPVIDTTSENIYSIVQGNNSLMLDIDNNEIIYETQRKKRRIIKTYDYKDLDPFIYLENINDYIPSSIEVKGNDTVIDMNLIIYSLLLTRYNNMVNKGVSKDEYIRLRESLKKQEDASIYNTYISDNLVDTFISLYNGRIKEVCEGLDIKETYVYKRN